MSERNRGEPDARVRRVANAKNVKLVAVFPSAIEASKTHLNELGLTSLDLKQSSLNAVQVGGTPTLILTNDKGEVTNYWIGKLTPEKEVEVISQI